MKRVWFNADDFGMSAGVSRGIVEAMNLGVVGTTTALIGSDIDDADIVDHASVISGRIGLHLQLTNGRPRLPANEVPSLVDSSGNFPRKRFQVKRPDPQEIVREWCAQADYLRHLGIEPTHLDFHHHVHLLPAAFEAYVELAQRLGLPARTGSPRVRNLLRSQGIRCADHFTARFIEPRCTAEHLFSILEESAKGMSDGELLEVMCHPGRPDERLAEISTYTTPRAQELALFTEQGLEDQLREIGFEVTKAPFP